MPHIKYISLKKYLLGLVLLVYLGGTLNQGMIEIIHVLSHQVTNGYNYHSHHHGVEESDHEHLVSNLFQISFEEFGEKMHRQVAKVQLSMDKIPSICPWVNNQIHSGGAKNDKNPFLKLQLPPSPFLQIIVPPPL